MAGITSIDEAIGLLGIMKLNDSQGINLSTSEWEGIFPESVHLLANWNLTLQNKVAVGIDMSKTPLMSNYADFGTYSMYPPQIKAFHDDSYDIVIIEGKDVVNAIRYCYAFEILMERTSAVGDPVYYGKGAFSLVYNPRAWSTSSYILDPNYKYPSDKNGKTYVSASLSRTKGDLLTWDLIISLRYLNSENASVIFTNRYTDINPPAFENTIEKGGISGVIDNNKINPVMGYSNDKGIVTDVQIVTPSEEYKIYAGNKNIQKQRNLFLDNFAFDHTLLDYYKI